MTFFYGHLHIDVLVSADQQKLIHISSVLKQDIIWETCWEQWIIGTDVERESRKSMLLVQLDDDSNLLSFLSKCDTRPYEWSTQWDSNSLMKVYLSCLLTITPLQGILDDLIIKRNMLIYIYKTCFTTSLIIFTLGTRMHAHTLIYK